MNQKSHERKSLFLDALEITSSAERNAFLNRACAGDDDLRAEISSLLRAHTDLPEAIDRLENGCAATIDIRSLAEQPGTQIGPYKLREQIGEGGFGIVYVAEQSQPIQRKVALKLIKLGMDSREIIARFEAERQVLAMMDHPHIAKVLDAGTTDEGRPYFVMELVNGLPLTKFCNQQKLSMTERLRLFIDICRAVQHAHQKGVIHRDIKPSNVLVTLHDGKPVAKVIDFGVAKALSRKLTEQTLYTALGQMVGTPLYMSPEQAEMSGLDVDTRSDIYSLGVLLYELLTGTTPFDRESLKNAGYAEVQRIIRETEPVKPSARLSTLKNKDRSTVCDQRQVDQRKLEQALRGDLDWVVMKALEKDRERRYASVADFADDVERYIKHRPVVAGPPSSLYRLRKHLRRHKLALTATALVLLSMIAGTGFSVWYALEAQDARDEARTSEGLANERLGLLQREQAKLRAEQQKLQDEKEKLAAEQQKSERHFTLAKTAVAKLIDGVASRNLVAFPELAGFRETLLETADDFYTQLLEESPGDAELLIARSVVRSRLNRISDAHDDLLLAAAKNPKSGRVHAELANFYRFPSNKRFRDPAMALHHARQAIAMEPKNSHYWYVLAWVYMNAHNDRTNAAAAMRRSAELTPNPANKAVRMGIALSTARRYPEAISTYTRALQDYPELAGKADMFLRRGCSYFGNEQYAEALEDFSESIQCNAYFFLAFEHRAACHFEFGNYRDALRDWEQAVRIQPSLADVHSVRHFFPPRKVLECHLRLQDWNGAVKVLNKLQSAFDTRGVDVDARHLNRSLFLSLELLRQIGATGHKPLLEARDRYVNRRDLYTRRLEDFLQSEVDRLESSDADGADEKQQRAEAYFWLGNMYFHWNQFNKALPRLDKSIALDPEFSEAYDRRGRVYASRNDLEKAVADFEKAIEFGNVYNSARPLADILHRAAESAKIDAAARTTEPPSPESAADDQQNND